MNKSTLALIPTVAICAAIFYVADRGGSKVPSNLASAPVVPATASMPPGSQLQHHPLEAPAAHPIEAASKKATSLASEMESSTNYRVFLERLLKDQPKGRMRYALGVLMSCGAVKNEDAFKITQPSISTKQQQARELLASRCGNFSDEEVSGSHQFDMARDPRLTDDPYKKLLSDLDKTCYAPESKRQALQVALDDAEPLLLQTLGPSVLTRAGKDEVMFDGKEYSQPYALQVTTLAWSAAVCEGTATACGTQDRYVTELCAVENVCADTRRDALAQDVQIRFGREGSALFAEVYPTMVRAIREKNLAPLGL